MSEGVKGHSLPTSQKIGYGFLCAGLVLFSGLMSGLTLGLLSLDRVELEVLKRSGTAEQKAQAQAVAPLVAKGHRLLVTLLLMNAAAMETLPIFLDKLTNPVGAILISVTMVLIFGEIVPQAICQRFGLAVGYKMRWLVWLLLWVACPVGIPVAKLLDYLLGEEEGGLFRRAQLKALVDIHGALGGHGGDLTTDETTIISGALDMSHKTVASAMTPIHRVRSVALNTPLTWPHLRAIVGCGHSRIPVHLPDDTSAIVGLLLVKELFAAIRLEDLQGGEGSPRTIVDAIKLRPIPKMNADTPLYTALNYFQTGRSHMAVVTQGKTVLYLDTPVSLVPSPGPGPAQGAEPAPPRLVRARAGSSDTVRVSGADWAPLLPQEPIILDLHAAQVPRALPRQAQEEGVLGILTLEDVLEELLQEEILDETDRAEGDEHVAQAANDLTLKEALSPSGRLVVNVPESGRWEGAREEAQTPAALPRNRNGGSSQAGYESLEYRES